MGLPGSAAYVIMATLVAPALVAFGFSVPIAHFFVIYFCMMSTITPPVCIASYAASALAGTNPISTGFYSMRLGFSGYLIPFAFAYNPSLLLIGSNLGNILVNITFMIIAIYALAASLEGYLINTRISLVSRIFLFFTGIIVVFPNIMLKVLPLVTILIVYMYRRLISSK